VKLFDIIRKRILAFTKSGVEARVRGRKSPSQQIVEEVCQRPTLLGLSFF